MTPGAFTPRWRTVELMENSTAQEHLIDPCRLLDGPTSAEANPKWER